MTWYHPVWTPPTDEEFKAGVAAVENAKDLGGQTEPERDYIDALATFFCTPGPAGTQPAGEGCPAAHEDRARRYTEAMARLHAKDPNEEETAAFYGLALLGSATPADPTFENQLKAGKLLDQVWRANRHHPVTAIPALVGRTPHHPNGKGGTPVNRRSAAGATGENPTDNLSPRRSRPDSPPASQHSEGRSTRRAPARR
jgi:hypothetical protein